MDHAKTGVENKGVSQGGSEREATQYDRRRRWGGGNEMAATIYTAVRSRNMYSGCRLLIAWTTAIEKVLARYSEYIVSRGLAPT